MFLLFFSCCRSLPSSRIKTTSCWIIQNKYNDGITSENLEKLSSSKWGYETYWWTEPTKWRSFNDFQLAEVVSRRIDSSVFVDWTKFSLLSSRKLSIIAHSSNVNADEMRLRSTRSALHARYLWIRTSLINRSLHKIIEYIVENSSFVKLNLFESFVLW